MKESKDKCQMSNDTRYCNDPDQGTCINLQEKDAGGLQHKCLCKDWFTGENCEKGNKLLNFFIHTN